MAAAQARDAAVTGRGATAGRARGQRAGTTWWHSSARSGPVRRRGGLRSDHAVPRRLFAGRTAASLRLRVTPKRSCEQLQPPWWLRRFAGAMASRLNGSEVRRAGVRRARAGADAAAPRETTRSLRPFLLSLRRFWRGCHWRSTAPRWWSWAAPAWLTWRTCVKTTCVRWGCALWRHAACWPLLRAQRRRPQAMPAARRLPQATRLT